LPPFGSNITAIAPHSDAAAYNAAMIAFFSSELGTVGNRLPSRAFPIAIIGVTQRDTSFS
jgi:hypothetical protein